MKLLTYQQTCTSVNEFNKILTHAITSLSIPKKYMFFEKLEHFTMIHLSAASYHIPVYCLTLQIIFIDPSTTLKTTIPLGLFFEFGIKSIFFFFFFGVSLQKVKLLTLFSRKNLQVDIKSIESEHENLTNTTNGI